MDECHGSGLQLGVQGARVKQVSRLRWPVLFRWMPRAPTARPSVQTQFVSTVECRVSSRIVASQKLMKSPHMARPLRIEFFGALYHLTSRGDRREDLFENDDDRLLFLAGGLRVRSFLLTEIQVKQWVERRQVRV